MRLHYSVVLSERGMCWNKLHNYNITVTALYRDVAHNHKQ